MNIVYKKMLILSSLISTSLINSIRVVYMVSFFITFDQVASLKGIFSIVVAFSEIPTGIIADKVSKKISMEIGAILFAIHSLCYIIIPNYFGFVLTQILLGLSGAFISGADDGYLDDYIVQKTNDDYLTIAGKIKYISGYIKVGLYLVSGFLFILNPQLNFFITFILGLISVVIIYTLPELNYDKKNIDNKFKIRKYFTDIFDIIKYTFSNSIILEVTLVYSLVVSLLIFNFEYYQFVLDKFNFYGQLYGILYASFNIIGGYAAKISKMLLNRLGIMKLFSLFILLISVSYIIFATAQSIWMILMAIFIQQLCFGSIGLVVKNVILKNVPNQSVKSTMLSINNSVMNVLKSVIVFILGFIYFKFGFTNLYYLMALIMMLIFIYIYFKNKFIGQ